MRKLSVAVLQLPLARPEPADNIAAVSALVEEAAGKGAQVILPPELFAGEYFCRMEEEELFDLAHPTLESPSVQAMQELAAKLGVAIPTSFFERDGQHYYNTLAMIGHAVSNCMPVCAANRIGHEGPADRQQSFYGHSFISDEWGDLVAEFGGSSEGVLTATLDLDRARKHRAGMGFFRDRRPQLYGRISEDI